jgi:hypothetical protein
VILRQPCGSSSSTARRGVPADSLRLRCPHAQPRDRSVHCPNLGGCARDGTSRQSKTHSTEVREIRYPWHPLYGRLVWIHGALVKGGQALYHCSLEQNHQAPLFQIPQWMFESGACCRMHRAEEPAVDCAALRDLKRLLHHTRSPGRDFVIEAQHHSSPGGTDARIGESTKDSANRVVSPSTTDSGLVKATASNPTENRKTTRATVARTRPENPSGEGAMQ